MKNARIQLNLRTVFLALAIAASVLAIIGIWALDSSTEYSTFRLQHDAVQLKQALTMRLEQGELNFPPELDRAERLVFLLGGFDGEPMYFDFSDSDQLVDVDRDGYSEYVSWNLEIPFVLDNGDVKWMNKDTDEILELEDVAEKIPQKPSGFYLIFAVATFVVCVAILFWRYKLLLPFFALLILWVMILFSGSGVH